MRRTLATTAVLLLVLGLAACGGGSSDDGASTSTTRARATTTTERTTTSGTSTTATSPSSSTTTTTTPGAPHRVRTYFVRGEHLATGGADVTGSAVGKGAVTALLKGPDAAGSAAKLATAIPAGTKLLGLDIANGTATVDLSSAFVSGGGSLSMQLRVGQVVFTLTQFPTVQKVHFRIDGKEVDALGGEGLGTTYTGRGSFTDVTPNILAETPTPGQTVKAPFTITGMSNTFEATLQYSVKAADGTVLAQGFATATAGTGTWGTFSIPAKPKAYSGPAVITLWEESMQGDGARLNVYEVPITLG